MEKQWSFTSALEVKLQIESHQFYNLVEWKMPVTLLQNQEVLVSVKSFYVQTEHRPWSATSFQEAQRCLSKSDRLIHECEREMDLSKATEICLEPCHQIPTSLEQPVGLPSHSQPAWNSTQLLSPVVGRWRKRNKQTNDSSVLELSWDKDNKCVLFILMCFSTGVIHRFQGPFSFRHSKIWSSVWARSSHQCHR